MTALSSPFPLLSEEGCLRAFFARRRGGVLSRVHHPVRSAKVAAHHFIYVASTLPRRGGEKIELQKKKRPTIHLESRGASAGVQD
jgi:hypothetical protein